MPYSFTARSEDDSKVRLEWMPAENCDPNTNPCTYDIHYWKADSKNLSSYTTVKVRYGLDGCRGWGGVEDECCVCVIIDLTSHDPVRNLIT